MAKSKPRKPKARARAKGQLKTTETYRHPEARYVQTSLMRADRSRENRGSKKDLLVVNKPSVVEE